MQKKRERTCSKLSLYAPRPPPTHTLPGSHGETRGAGLLARSLLRPRHPVGRQYSVFVSFTRLENESRWVHGLLHRGTGDRSLERSPALGMRARHPQAPRTLGAVGASPASRAVAGPVRGAAGGVVSTLAGHTAFAIAARRTGCGEGAPGDGVQVPAPQLALDPPTVSLRPSHCGLKAGETQGAALRAAGEVGGGAHVSGRRGRGSRAHTRSCRSQGCRCPHSYRCRCCYSWLPRSPEGRAGGSGYLRRGRGRVSLLPNPPPVPRGSSEHISDGMHPPPCYTVGLGPRHPKCSPVQPGWH